MRRIPRLGDVNLALVSLYFAPAWGRDALRMLLSPYTAFEDRGHVAVAIYLREVFDLGIAGLLRVSSALAGLKLVIAAGFVAYLIELARAAAVGRELDRETRDGALALGAIGVLIWAIPGLLLGDPALVTLSATQVLLIAGAVAILTVEAHTEPSVRCIFPAASTTLNSRLAQVGAWAVPPTKCSTLFAGRTGGSTIGKWADQAQSRRHHSCTLAPPIFRGQLRSRLSGLINRGRCGLAGNRRRPANRTRRDRRRGELPSPGRNR
jgi:hypothetical protein